MNSILFFRSLSCSVLLGFASIQAVAYGQSNGLETTTGQALGVSLINYKYDEPGIMNLKATKLVLDYSATRAFGSPWPNSTQVWFLKGEIKYANGKADYVGSGSKNGNEDWYYELRGLAGRDYNLGTYVLAPYVGLGYRHLYNDLRGFTSTGNIGYLRENRLTTAVVGLTHRTKTGSGHLLESSFEYAYLLNGEQEVGPEFNGTKLSLDQENGYGLRLSVMWKMSQWSFGPTYTYWNIDDSEIGPGGAFEPKNKTTEIGLKAAYHF